MRLILASASPRRQELLALLGVPFGTADPGDVERADPGHTPLEMASLFAERKVRSYERRDPDALDLVIVGSDTLIAVEDEVLGKPEGPAAAERMLRRLSGRPHTVYTAVAVHRPGEGAPDIAVDAARVWFKSLAETALKGYLATQEWAGKAGAYAIQGHGGDLVDHIDGDFTSVVGLPLRLTAEMLRRHGVPVSVDLEQLYRDAPYPNWKKFSP
jgi:septum formation protein